VKWPWQHDGPDPEATVARESMRRQLREAQAQKERAQRLAEQLRETTRRNHFGEAVTRAMRRHT
jgi:predicted Holliday junction resolvase-like endonuclease